MANMGAFAALFVMRDWDTWTVDGWRQLRSALSADQVRSL